MLTHLNLSQYTSQDLQQTRRLFHGRGHAYPGLEHLCIDWLPPVALIITYKEVDQKRLDEIAQQLIQSLPQCKSVQVQFRCRNKAPYQLLLGEQINHVNALEHNLKYHLQLGQAQNSGLFLDMRNGRKWVIENSKAKNVLNLFSYTCAFSVAAIAGGAKQVVNVDISKSPLAKGRENHRLNGHNLQQVKFEGVDIFKSYGRLKKHGPYDLLICDPPSFQKGSVDIKRDYPKIIRRLPQLMNDNGLLMLCLNSPDLDDEFIHQMIKNECPQCEFTKNIAPPKVYKEAMPGKGLKVLIFKYKSV